MFIGDPGKPLLGKSVEAVLLTDLLAGDEKTTLAGVKSSRIPAIEESESLYSAFNLLASTGSDIVAVTADGKVAGTVSFRDIARVYHCRVHSKFASDL